MNQNTFYSLEAKDMNGKMVKMEEFIGKILVIVNVASECGLKQSNYKNFKQIKEKYLDDVIFLLFPCNQFMNQNPGTVEETKEDIDKFFNDYCFFDEIDVRGKNTDKLFAYLKKQECGWLGSFIKWNFTKFLINKEGKVIKRFGPTEPIKEEDINALI